MQKKIKKNRTLPENCGWKGQKLCSQRAEPLPPLPEV